jgi:hypothetical protein
MFGHPSQKGHMMAGVAAAFKSAKTPAHLKPHLQARMKNMEPPDGMEDMQEMQPMAMPNSKAPLGQGGRFAALKNKLASRPGVKNPGALAAFIGKKKYGAKKMSKMAAAGKKSSTFDAFRGR